MGMIEKILALRGLTGGSDTEGLKITDASYLFYYGARLNAIDVLLADCKPTNCEHMFHSCNKLEEIPYFDTSECKTFDNAFCNCYKLKQVPPIDISNAYDYDNCFANCKTITSVPDLMLGMNGGDSIKNQVSCCYMFENCLELVSVGVISFDTTKLTGCILSSMFSNCTKLKTIEGLEMGGYMSGNQSYFTYTSVFNKCSAIENLKVYNVQKSLTVGSGTSWGHLLTVDSLVHTIKELCTASSGQTLTMGSANLEKISGLYCRIIDPDHKKKTMELCESTDEGAMTLIDYAAEKNWSIN